MAKKNGKVYPARRMKPPFGPSDALRARGGYGPGAEWYARHMARAEKKAVTPEPAEKAKMAVKNKPPEKEGDK